jgi:hypothetical protein
VFPKRLCQSTKRHCVSSHNDILLFTDMRNALLILISCMVYVFMYVCTCLCMYICMYYENIYVFMYVCLYVGMYMCM